MKGRVLRYGIQRYFQEAHYSTAIRPEKEGGAGKAGNDFTSRALGAHRGQSAAPAHSGSGYARESGKGDLCTFGYDKKYADLTKEAVAEDGKHNVYYYGAPLVLYVCYDRTACWRHPQNGKSSGQTDATIVATHMMLEAASIGLGTVWISCFDEDKARSLLQLPEHWEPACMLYIGYPAKDFRPNPKMSGKRHPLEQTVFRNRMDLSAE